MINTDMLLFQVNQITNPTTGVKSQTVDVHDMWSDEDRMPWDDTMKGGT